MVGIWSGDALISCRQITSGRSLAIHSARHSWRSGWRARIPLTFHVAIFMPEGIPRRWLFRTFGRGFGVRRIGCFGEPADLLDVRQVRDLDPPVLGSTSVGVV